jgi:hypothetical protein
MDGGGGRLPVDGNCGRPPPDGTAVRLRRTALEDGPGGRRPRRLPADVRGIVGRVRTSGRVTTLGYTAFAWHTVENIIEIIIKKKNSHRWTYWPAQGVSVPRPSWGWGKASCGLNKS